jgi:hypothetical protein
MTSATRFSADAEPQPSQQPIAKIRKNLQNSPMEIPRSNDEMSLGSHSKSVNLVTKAAAKNSPLRTLTI